MHYKGTVKAGVVVLEPTASLPDGTEVWVEPLGQSATSLGDRLLKHAGVLADLPPDMAENHDHYIHGQSGK